MRKTKRNRVTKQNKNDEKFARKVIGQTVACAVVFCVAFVNSKLPNSVSKQINDSIKHYLYASVDFREVISTAKVYVEGVINRQQTVPVNTGDVLNLEEDNQ